MSVIRMENVHKRFGDLEVLKGVSLEVAKGEVVVIVGPSGSGKSTLLRCVNRLMDPDEGEVYIDGVPITGVKKGVESFRRQVGMVFQNFNLFTHLTALQNVTVGMTKVLGISAAAAEKTGVQLLEKVGLADKADSYPAELSGGQQQRVAIARALAMNPKAVLFDEPTSALDPELIGEVLEVMVQLAKEGMTMLVVSHEMGFVRGVANRVLFLAEGVILEEGPPEEILEHPAHERVRDFISKILT